MKKLNFGTAGIPLTTTKPTTLNGIKRVRELGLDSMEMEFVRGVNISIDNAKIIKKENDNYGVILTAHGPYYINLNASEKSKIEASKKRIIDTAISTYYAGGYSITFHAGYYIKQDKLKVYNTIKNHLKDIVYNLRNQGIEIWIRPELTGKETQFGDLNELINLSQDIENVLPCIDFAHYHARYNGKYNNYESYKKVLEIMEKELGKESLNNMHIHMSGINYGPKGEKNHLPLEESDIKWKDIIKLWKEFNIKGVVVSESPIIEQDALLMKEYWNSL